MSKVKKGVSLCRVKRTYSQGVTRLATREEALLGISAKLLEEAGEVMRAPKDIEEYADVLQVLKDMAELNGIPWSKVMRSYSKKADDKGGFLFRGEDGEYTALLWTPGDGR